MFFNCFHLQFLLFQDVLNNHITQFKSLVGKNSGTLQEMPPKKVKDLAKKGGKQFEREYKDALPKNSGNLVPMLEILHGIADNENTVKNLSKKEATSATTPTDYQSLKEKLLQQVGSKAFLEAPGSSKQIQFPKMFQDRKYLTLDYVKSSEIEQDGPEYGPLSCVPVSSQEMSIVQDLLYCFIGINGVHVKPTRKGDKIHFDIDPKVNPTLKELLKRITPLCSHYSTVVSFVERHSLMGSGCVNQALAQALGEVLKDYYVFVAQLETQHRLGELTLNKMWSYIQPTMDAMSFMSDLCSTIERMNARGGKTLSLLHEKCVTQSLASTEKLRDLGLLLTKSAAETYFEILRRWIHRGIIEDPGKDFFVEDNEVIGREVLPLEYSDDYWERRYSIKADQIPAFLHSNVDKILRTGKYLNVIQQCEQGKTNKTYYKAKPKPKTLINPFKKPSDTTDAKDDDDEDLRYFENPEEYNEPLEKAYCFASKNLLDLLVREKDLIGHLRSVKHYFLLDQGDFIVQFMDLCSDELCQSVDSVEPTRLESLLELALRTSAAKEDPYKDNVRVELLPYDLIFQMNKIMSIDTQFEGNFKKPVDTSELTCLEAFAFGYDVQWPISLVLNRKSLACYQMLLRHLLYCKYVEKLLTNVWINTKVLKDHSDSIYNASLALKQKMIHFLQNLEYYMTFEVLEPTWEDLIGKCYLKISFSWQNR